MASRVPFWPLTRSPLMEEFKSALIRRSKALKHQLFEWTCERMISEEDDRRLESLLVRMRTHRPELSIRLWEDGDLWFYARELRSRKIAFELSFHGRLGPNSCGDLVETLENTFTPAAIRADSNSAKKEILAQWEGFAPSDADYGRA